MKKIFYSMMVIFALVMVGCQFGCEKGTGIGGTTVGDGKVDAVEAAELRVIIGLTLGAKPAAIAPAYAVSTALLITLNNVTTQNVVAGVVDQVIAAEVKKLKLDPVTEQSFNDLVYLIRVRIEAKYKISALPESQRLVVVKDIVQIVHDASASRLGIPSK